MGAVRNALTKPIADTEYLRLDTTNDPLTGDLEFSKIAPLITFTDLGGATADEDWTIGTAGDDLKITNIDSLVNGYLDLDHLIRVRQNVNQPLAGFTGSYAIAHAPTFSITGGAVQGYFLIQDNPTITIGGVYNSYGIITAQGTVTCTTTNALEALYLFVNVMNNTATTGNYPASIHSFESKPRVFAATGVVPGAMPSCVGFNDWTNVVSEGTGQITVTDWVTVSAMQFNPFYYRIVTDNASGSVTITNRIGFEMEEVTKSGGGGTETIVNYYGFLFHPFTNGSTLACAGWIGKQTGATNNYGIVFDGDGIGCEARFGDGQDAAIYYDDTNLILDPDIVGTGKVLIGATGDDDMLLTNLEVAGDITINADNNGVIFGGGQDAKIYYDNTDLIINPKVVGTGAVNILGDLIFTGDDTGLPFGEIWVHDNTTTMSVSSAGYTQVVIFDTNGESNNCTPDHTNDHITIVEAGRYLLTLSLTVINNAGVGHTIDVDVSKNNMATDYDNCHASRTLAAGTDVGSVSISGIIDAAVNDTIEVWITTDRAIASDITVEDITLSLVCIGGT
jgi:hypothetical protein